MAHTATDLKHQELPLESTGRLAASAPALSAIILGVLLLYGVGFAQPSAIHDAAHDSRHGIGFPCH